MFAPRDRFLFKTATVSAPKHHGFVRIGAPTTRYFSTGVTSHQPAVIFRDRSTCRGMSAAMPTVATILTVVTILAIKTTGTRALVTRGPKAALQRFTDIPLEAELMTYPMKPILVPVLVNTTAPVNATSVTGNATSTVPTTTAVPATITVWEPFVGSDELNCSVKDATGANFRRLAKSPGMISLPLRLPVAGYLAIDITLAANDSLANSLFVQIDVNSTLRVFNTPISRRPSSSRMILDGLAPYTTYQDHCIYSSAGNHSLRVGVREPGTVMRNVSVTLMPPPSIGSVTGCGIGATRNCVWQESNTMYITLNDFCGPSQFFPGLILVNGRQPCASLRLVAQDIVECVIAPFPSWMNDVWLSVNSTSWFGPDAVATFTTAQQATLQGLMLPGTVTDTNSLTASFSTEARPVSTPGVFHIRYEPFPLWAPVLAAAVVFVLILILLVVALIRWSRNRAAPKSATQPCAGILLRLYGLNDLDDADPETAALLVDRVRRRIERDLPRYSASLYVVADQRPSATQLRAPRHLHSADVVTNEVRVLNAARNALPGILHSDPSTILIVCRKASVAAKAAAPLCIIAQDEIRSVIRSASRGMRQRAEGLAASGKKSAQVHASIVVDLPTPTPVAIVDWRPCQPVCYEDDLSGHDRYMYAGSLVSTLTRVSTDIMDVVRCSKSSARELRGEVVVVITDDAQEAAIVEDENIRDEISRMDIAEVSVGTLLTEEEEHEEIGV